jgi:hypothetical protein
LAWAGKGFTVDLIKCDDNTLDKFLEWAKETTERENAEYASRKA